MPENKTHTDLPTDVTYQASSPGKRGSAKASIDCSIFLDEFALVQAMQQIGVVFFSRTPDGVTINFVSNHLHAVHQ